MKKGTCYKWFLLLSIAVRLVAAQQYYDTIENSINDNSFHSYANGLEKEPAEEKKRWAVQITYDRESVHKGFNSCGSSTPLSHLVFNQAFTFEDISLFVKLSDCNKVRNCAVPADVNRSQFYQRPAGSHDPFGMYRNDLYTTLLAPVSVCIDAEQKESEGGVTFLHYFECSTKCEIEGYVGIHIPIQSRLHSMDLQLYGGSLFTSSEFSSNQTERTNSLFQFYQDYSDLHDFFIRGILAQKCLAFDPRQQKTGFGDIALFGTVDLERACNWLDSWQVGMTLVCPSGGKLKSDKVWEVYLGNGGAFQLDLFTAMVVNTGSQYWNPTVRAAVEVSFPFTTCYRLSQYKKNETIAQADAISDFLVPGPSIFPDYWVDPFNEIDSPIPWFADEALPTRIKWGTKWFVGIGNYFYDVFIPNFRLGMFYDYSGKTQDHYKPRCCDKEFCPNVLECYTKEQTHRLGWNLAYTFENLIELSLGSQHIIAGHNVAQTHDIFASLVIVF